MTYKHFAKLANEAVYLKQLDFKLMKNAVKSAVAEILGNEQYDNVDIRPTRQN